MEASKKLKLCKILGVVPYDLAKINNMKKNESYIINTDSSKQGGQHWTSFFSHDNKIYFYDTYARTITETIPELKKKIQKPVININKEPDQKGITTNCGQLSLTFLYVFYKYGFDVAKRI